MKSTFLKFWIVVTLGFVSCEPSFDPNKHLDPHEKDVLMMKLIRYVGKPPSKPGTRTKFDPSFDDYYSQLASVCKLEKFYEANGRFYFLISQPAPSLVEKRHATGGVFELDGKGEFASYEEIFRTWKMVPDTLQKRSSLLFEKMVAGEPLTPYTTAKSNGIEYIEFPDERTFYDKEKRAWAIADF